MRCAVLDERGGRYGSRETCGSTKACSIARSGAFPGGMVPPLCIHMYIWTRPNHHMNVLLLHHIAVSVTVISVSDFCSLFLKKPDFHQKNLTVGFFQKLQVDYTSFSIGLKLWK